MFTDKKTKMSFAAAFTAVIILCCIGCAKNSPKDNLTIGQRFHHQTALTPTGTLADALSAKPPRPAQYKLYPNAEKIKLPQPQHRGIAVEQAIAKRRSVRNYSAEPIGLADLSQLLFAAQGVTAKAPARSLRAAPSAGALYPFEIYIVVNNVKDLPQGIYHYAVADHCLELIKAGNFTSDIVKAGLNQDKLGKSAVTFVLAAVFDRTRCKYGERGFRYIYMEAGHISQNICLQAVSLNLGTVTVGGFLDEEVNKLVEIDGRNEAAIYLQPVGKP